MTPTELNLKAKALLETHFDDIVLSGEISKITLHGSGHWYFALRFNSVGVIIFLL